MGQAAERVPTVRSEFPCWRQGEYTSGNIQQRARAARERNLGRTNE